MDDEEKSKRRVPSRHCLLIERGYFSGGQRDAILGKDWEIQVGITNGNCSWQHLPLRTMSNNSCKGLGITSGN